MRGAGARVCVEAAAIERPRARASREGVGRAERAAAAAAITACARAGEPPAALGAAPAPGPQPARPRGEGPACRRDRAQASSPALPPRGTPPGALIAPTNCKLAASRPAAAAAHESCSRRTGPATCGSWQSSSAPGAAAAGGPSAYTQQCCHELCRHSRPPPSCHVRCASIRRAGGAVLGAQLPHYWQCCWRSSVRLD
jgi:hypothetical protein